MSMRCMTILPSCHLLPLVRVVGTAVLLGQLRSGRQCWTDAAADGPENRKHGLALPENIAQTRHMLALFSR